MTGLWIITWWVGGALGVAALVVVVLALFRDRSRGRRRCPRCWYDMTGVAGMRCPECGREQKAERRFFRTRRRWRGVVLGAVMLALAAGTAVAPAAYTGGWAKYTPMPLLRFGVSLFDRQAQELESRSATSNAATLSARERLLLAHRCSVRLRSLLNDPSRKYLPRLAWSPFPGSFDDYETVFWTATLLGAEVKPLLPELVAAMRSSDPDVRRGATLALRGAGVHAKPVVPELRRLVAGAEASAAVEVLVAVGASDTRTLRVMHRIAAHAERAALRADATRALVFLDGASVATEELVVRLALSDDDVPHQLTAVNLLSWYAHLPFDATASPWLPPRPVPSELALRTLVKMLDSPAPAVRRAVSDVAAKSGEAGAPLGPALRRAIDREDDPSLRRSLILAYASLPTTDVSMFIDELWEALRVEALRSEWAAQTLTVCGPRASVLIPGVAEIIADPTASLRLRRELCGFLSAAGEGGRRQLDSLTAAHEVLRAWESDPQRERRFPWSP